MSTVYVVLMMLGGWLTTLDTDWGPPRAPRLKFLPSTRTCSQSNETAEDSEGNRARSGRIAVSRRTRIAKSWVGERYVR